MSCNFNGNRLARGLLTYMEIVLNVVTLICTQWGEVGKKGQRPKMEKLYTIEIGKRTICFGLLWVIF